MASQAQIDANRVNAQHSTGPRTDDGKARSSRNALKHGLNAREFFVPEDEQHEFAELGDSLAEELHLQTALEQNLFSHILHAAWTLHRVRRMEAEILATSPDPLAGDDAHRLELLARYQTRAERSYHRNLNELRRHSTNVALRGTLPYQYDKQSSHLVEPHLIHRGVRLKDQTWREYPKNIFDDPDNPPPPEPRFQGRKVTSDAERDLLFGTRRAADRSAKPAPAAAR
jgi:hypothetical protein